MAEEEKLHCSFCGKSQDEVKKLVAGRGVYICDECIEVCISIVSDEMNIFLSHRRLDGEEITASICDTLNAIAPEKNYFRDIVNVKTGENAQEIIDSRNTK